MLRLINNTTHEVLLLTGVTRYLTVFPSDNEEEEHPRLVCCTCHTGELAHVLSF
jgi:hypothetical protein